MNKTLYTVERYCDVLKRWVPILSATTCISKMFCKGFVSGMAQHYPCPRLRVVDDGGTVHDEHAGHGPMEAVQSPRRRKEADNVRLRAVVEAMAGGDLTLSQTTDGTWLWADEPADDDMFYRWRGAYTTAADAALARLAELGKDKTT